MSADAGNVRYPREFEPNTSHANAVTLLDKSAVTPGVVLDIGCGNAPAAEPLADRGFEYVGLDVDRRSLDSVRARGFETHRLDLGVAPARLEKNLREIVGDRRVAVILALDVLEHVIDPRSVVEVLAAVAADQPECNLVVSIPNLTHRDVVTRLLLAQWEMTEVGLLDDTHVRFFSPDGLDELFDGTGWLPADALDTTAEYTEQYTLLRSPALQPGAPLGDFLRRVRALAAPHATTYQFVRRMVFAAGPAAATSDESPDDRRFLTVIVMGSDDERTRLLADLDAQSDTDFEAVELADGATYAEVNVAIERASTHYLCVVGPGHRLGPGFVAALRRGASNADDSIATDCVVRIDAVAVDAADLVQADEDFEGLVGDRVPIEPDGFDLLRSDVLGSTALAAYGVPVSALRTLGIRFEPALGAAAPAVFLARVVEMCSLRGVGASEVAVDGERVRAALDDLDAVRDGLGPGAFLLPPGGVGRLASQRRTLVESLAAERALRKQLDDLHPRIERAESERDRLDAELQSMLNSRLWKATEIVRKFYVRSRRLAGRVRRARGA